MSGGPGHAWRGIIAVHGKPHLYDLMTPPGGYTAANPATVCNSVGRSVEVHFGKGGKKVIKRVGKAKDEERKMSPEEAMEDPKKMFKYLKQKNKRDDIKWEEKELAKYKGDD